MTVDNQTKQVDELMDEIYNTGLDIRKEVKAKLLKLLAQAEARGRDKHEGIGAYLAMSKIIHHLGYLLAHRSQGLPEMTGKVIGELYADVQAILKENEKYMRSKASLKERKPE